VQRVPYQHHTEHFEGFDSFNVIMHKWLLTTFDTRYKYYFVSRSAAASIDGQSLVSFSDQASDVRAIQGRANLLHGYKVMRMHEVRDSRVC